MKENEFLANAAMLTNIDAAIRHLTKQLDDVNLELETQKLQHITPDAGHPNVAAWSKEIQVRSKDMCALLTSVCGVGAAITYTTIFSAVRGSVGLMSWAFTFFLMGFTLPTGSQMALSWAAAIMPPNTKFPSSLLTFWAFNAAATIVWGVLCTVFAVFFLLASLYEIQYSPVASGESSALLIFTNSPKYAFWLAVSCISIGCLHIIGLNLVLICCNSWESLRGMYLLN
ncbi:hypothetical protein F5887DRAFT_603415 [Amanita rubescens]|nr:hypothetical protein F5887DRAFT_603415 [Amanita rubescens]